MFSQDINCYYYLAMNLAELTGHASHRGIFAKSCAGEEDAGSEFLSELTAAAIVRCWNNGRKSASPPPHRCLPMLVVPVVAHTPAAA